jgi:acyl carrier protein
MDFIELFDAVVRDCKPTLDDYIKPKSMDDKLEDLGLDSLDFALIFMTLGDMHGIPDEIADSPPKLNTMQGAKDFIDEHKVKTFDSVEAAMGAVK